MQHMPSGTYNTITVPNKKFACIPVYSRILPRLKCSDIRGCKALAKVESGNKQNGSSSASPMATEETDYVVVGSGIGGLCCAALLARYGQKVTVCEAHYLPGGAAQSFDKKGYQFDAGPSFFAGLSGEIGSKSSNPLKQVLNAIKENVACITYDQWILYNEEKQYPVVCDGDKYRAMIRREGGQTALEQWLSLEAAMKPLQTGASSFPAAAIRSDIGVAITAAKFGIGLAKTGLIAGTLTGPFSKVVDQHVSDPWLRRMIDLECFVLSGMKAKDTITAEMAFMFGERNDGESTIDYPMEGSKAIVEALLRGIKKFGGQVLLSSPVEEIVVEGGRAAGVKLKRNPRRLGYIRAKKAVISNASLWDTQKLLPRDAISQKWSTEAQATSMTGSFMHLHLGIDAEGLPDDLGCHHLIVNNFSDIEAEQNVCIVSIPSVFNPNLSPPGKFLVHAYCAANESYSNWEGMDRKSQEYKDLKEERSQCLWKALERVIPDIRERTELTLIGTPLTHERYLNRHRGTYGPAISAADGSFPGPATDIPGLYRCGDSTMPGIGVPAAAASGMIAANTLSSVWNHLKLLNDLKY